MSFPRSSFRRKGFAPLATLIVGSFAIALAFISPIRSVRAGNTWVVDPSYSSSECNSDNLRCASLKDAVAAAESGDRIRIIKGRFDGESNILIDSKNLTIIGAGQPQIVPAPGGGTMVDESSGTWITAFNKCPNCSVLTSAGRVFDIKNSTVNISGMWITAGNSHGGNGGTVLNEGGTLTFSDVKITGDSEGGNGGAVYNDQGTISFSDCSIFGISGAFDFSGPQGGSGGGIYNNQGTLQITRCSVGGDIGHSQFRDAGSGGGLFNKGGTVTIVHSAIENSLIGGAGDGNMPGTTPNRNGFAGGRGAGIYNEYPGKVTISDTEIRSNEAGQGGSGGDGGGLTLGSGHPGANGGAGGGIYNEGEMTITGCTIAGNKSGDGGAGGSSASSPGSGSDGGVGGGIYNGGDLTITNSTISDNTTGGGGRGGAGTTAATSGGNGGSGGRGGGLYNQNKSTLINITVSGNTTGGSGAGGTGGDAAPDGSAGSSGNGGGVVSDTSVSGAAITVRNTIVAGNSTSSGGSNPDVIGTFLSAGHNLVGVSSANGFTAPGDQKGSAATPLDAKLGARQSNGGPTSTYDLADDSPAINAGDDSVTGAPSNLTNDQRGLGYLRNYNGHVDIGAVEKQPPSNPPVARCQSLIVSAQSFCQYALSASEVDGGSSDPDAGDTLTFSLDQSGPFGLGSHNLTLTVTDNRGLSSSCATTVTVVDDVPPVITAPPGRLFHTGPGATLAGVVLNNLDSSLGTATAADNCSTVIPVRSGVPAGNFFPIGTTTLTYTGTDAQNKTGSATQNVEVIDDTPPTITAPADRTFNTGPGSTLSGVVISNLDGSLGTATAHDNGSVASVIRSGVPAGNFFPIGTTTLTYIVTDGSGNQASATQKVKVIDNTPPTITAPPDRTLNTGPGSTLSGVVISNLDALLGTATAHDNGSVASVIRSGVPAGNFFPIGTTTLTYTVTDGSGNQASATQKVKVIDNTAPTIAQASTSPSVLWPPNSKMIDVFVAYTTGDNSGGVVVTSLSIKSNEPVSAGDMVVLDNHHVRLKAERLGKGTGRVYTITITAIDQYGNSFQRTVTVTVPHD